MTLKLHSWNVNNNGSNCSVQYTKGQPRWLTHDYHSNQTRLEKWTTHLHLFPFVGLTEDSRDTSNTILHPALPLTLGLHTLLFIHLYIFHSHVPMGPLSIAVGMGTVIMLMSCPVFVISNNENFQKNEQTWTYVSMLLNSPNDQRCLFSLTSILVF